MSPPGIFYGGRTVPTIQKIARAVLWIIASGAVIWLLWWLVDFLGLPQPFAKIANGVLAVGGVFLLIAIILDLVGISLIKWGPPQ